MVGDRPEGPLDVADVGVVEHGAACGRDVFWRGHWVYFLSDASIFYSWCRAGPPAIHRHGGNDALETVPAHTVRPHAHAHAATHRWARMRERTQSGAERHDGHSKSMRERS